MTGCLVSFITPHRDENMLHVHDEVRLCMWNVDDEQVFCFVLLLISKLALRAQALLLTLVWDWTLSHIRNRTRIESSHSQQFLCTIRPSR